MKPRGLFDRIIEKLIMKQTEEIENILNEQIQAEDIEDEPCAWEKWLDKRLKSKGD